MLAVAACRRLTAGLRDDLLSRSLKGYMIRPASRPMSADAPGDRNRDQGHCIAIGRLISHGGTSEKTNEHGTIN